jgi:hypothetical protein
MLYPIELPDSPPRALMPKPEEKSFHDPVLFVIN